MTTVTTKKSVLILVSAILLYGIVAGYRAATGIFTSEISSATGLSYGTISGIFAIRNAIFAFSCIFFGIISRKIPVRYLLASGALLVAIGLVGAAFSSEYVLLLIFLGIFIGIGAGALCYAVVYAAASPFLGTKNSAVCAGIISASQGVFNILITPFAQTLGSSSVGLTICFVILGAIITCLVPLCFFFKKKKSEEPEEPVSSEKRSILALLKYMVKQPLFYMIALSYAVYGICDGGMVNHLFEKLTGLLSFDSGHATYILMVYGFAMIIGPILGGLVARHIKNLRLAIGAIFSLWMAISISMFCLPMNLVSLTFVVFGLGLTISSFVPMMCIFTQKVTPETLFASVFPILATFEFLGSSFNAYFGGFCFDMFNNFKLSMIVTCVLCSIVIVFFLISGLKHRKEKNSGELPPS